MLDYLTLLYIYLPHLNMDNVEFYCAMYEGWNFNSGNYSFTTDTKKIHVSKFYCPSM